MQPPVENYANMDNCEFKQFMKYMISKTPNENPLDYFNYMYKSVNPEMINLAVDNAKEVLNSQKHKNGKQCNVFLSIGGDDINQMFFNGVIATLLWLPCYLDDAVDMFKLDRVDVDTTKKILDKIKLPKAFDAYDVKDSNNKTIKVEPSNCRHYVSFLSAITRWATNGVTCFKNTGQPRSNMELVRYLTATALNSFPSIPWCSYFIGETKAKNLTKLAENLTKSVDFTQYMSTEAYQLNQPRFVVTANNSPLVGISGHPLSQLFVGQTENNKTEWIGVFANNDEFGRLCTENGFSVDEVRDYVLGVTKSQHERIICEPKSKYHSVAKFIDKQQLLKSGFLQLHRFEESCEDCNPNNM